MFSGNGAACGGGGNTGPCLNGLSWFGPTPGGQVYFNGNNFNNTSRISYSRSVRLSSPANAFRSDSLSLSEPAPKLAKNTLTITTKGGPFRGSATMSAGNASTQRGASCTASGHTYTSSNKVWSNATWKTTTSNRFVVNFAITPDYKTPLSKGGLLFEQESYS